MSSFAYLGPATASEHLAAELKRASTETAAPVEVLERLLAAEVGSGSVWVLPHPGRKIGKGFFLIHESEVTRLQAEMGRPAAASAVSRT